MKSPRSTSIIFILIIIFSSSLSALQPGDEVPGFSVVSGSGQILIRDDLTDRKIMLFYEDRSQMSLNQDLKEYINSLSLDNNSVLTVAVVNCSDVGLLKKIWEDRLVDQSRKTGIPVYGDWNGKMKNKFNYKDDSNAFLVIDEAGKVIYAREGVVASSEFSRIGSLVQ
ncbi:MULTISPECIES: YtfJ family protein [unclassified Oceanispirochaeta]|uniref:YtfJ family protein n=1 Tax=unclassified Oceanispirochaeta TaxID=2635722 RepID=UPI001314B026|nr:MULTISPECIES: YtfJ family protein [unclassified Oceanispirochaeta]MBF9014859.1 hypothetical protein [Oceanispirochaeta sp. M2]NPD71460.1 hypothetical protein [Oceanispirochaeta sp. M1]